MQKKQSEYPLIEITWDDHWIENEDVSMEHIQKEAKPYVGKYAGYLVYENKQVLVIASNVWQGEDEEKYGPTMYIMKRSVTSRSDKK